MGEMRADGPLAGVKIIEMAGVGPAPFCAMLLADLGATVLRIERPEPAALGIPRPRRFDLVLRGRTAIRVDLRAPQGTTMLLELIGAADALIEGFRPGVMEKLGLGPEACIAANERLVYGRVTGWGQTGPLAMSAGHDLNYIAVTGVLDAIGPPGAAPSIPLNLLGDYAGGAMYLAVGLLAGIVEARSSGKGQVVDTAMVDGVASLSSLFHGLIAGGVHKPDRGSNILDGGAPFYNVYQCKDGRWVTIAPIEPRFYQQLLSAMGVDPAELGEQYDPRHWLRARQRFAEIFASASSTDWASRLENTDACFSVVESFAQAHEHPQLKSRGTFIEIDGICQPAPAPRFSRTPARMPSPPMDPDPNRGAAALSDWLAPARIDALIRAGVLA